MPIDPNIALGIRPIEQPNMLGQMGQMMALRSAQQEYEGTNALRDAYAQGGDLSDPEFRRRIMAANPKLGSQLISQNSEMRARDVGTIEKRKALFDNQIKSATTPEHMAQITQAMYSDPDVGPMLVRIRPLTDSLASIPTDPKGLEEYRRRMTLGADNLFESANAKLQAQVSREGHGVQMYGHNVSAANNMRTDARERAKLHFVTGDNGFYGINQYNASATPVGMAAPPPQAQPSVTNALANPVTANTVITPPVNGLLPTAQSQPGAPTVANATALSSTLRPPARAGYEYDTQGKQVPIFDPQKVVRNETDASGKVTAFNERGGIVNTTAGAGKPTATFEKEALAVQKLPEAIAMNKEAIRKIDEMIGGVDAEGKPLAGKAGKPHEGFGGAVGMGLGARFIPGTAAKSFEIRHKEVLSQAFLDAFEALKGGGAITEKEGEKATSARTRMDLAQSETEYRTAAREYQGVLRRGIANAERRATQGSASPAPTSAATNAASNVIDFGSLK